MTTSPIGTVRDLLSTVRDDLRERREARASYRALRQEFATYRTEGEINDLLGVLSAQEGPEAEQIRDILLSNLATKNEQYRAA